MKGDILAFAFSMYFFMSAETVEEFARDRVFVLTLGFLPWPFAYAGTRVICGIETIMEG